MIIFKEPDAISKSLFAKRQLNKSIGFVPTMGALHAGHLQLISQAHAQNDVVACSIFVNPAQFNDQADFEKYPSTIERDIRHLEEAGCDVLLLPDVKSIYPNGFHQPQVYDLGALETRLEGHYRPGHFQGVCRVVHRLMNIVNPDKLYLGQKDFQQCMVIQRLLKIIGSRATIVISPTLREPDGLAMSSRNVRLSQEGRKKAPAIFQILDEIRKNIRDYPPAMLKAEAVTKLSAVGFKVDYVEIAAAETLDALDTLNGAKTVVALAAAYLEEVRLIDNIIIRDL